MVSIIKSFKYILYIYLVNLMSLFIASYICILFKILPNSNQANLLIMFTLFCANIALGLFLINKYKIKYLIEKLSIKDSFKYFLLGITYSLSLNLIFYFLKLKFNLTNSYQEVSINFITIITSSIVGPIIEEIIFRHLVFTELKKHVKYVTACVMSCLVFTIMHLNIFTSFYALGLSIILMISYIRTKNLLVPIVIHISANLIVYLYDIIIKINKMTTLISILIVTSLLFGYLLRKWLLNNLKRT